MKYLVIGGNAGGASFATRMRRIDEHAEILVINRGANISYASCALPYYIGDVVQNRAAIIERTPEVLKEKNNIDVRVNQTAVGVQPTEQTVIIMDQATGQEYPEQYDKLILATGASPTLPQIAGLKKASNVFKLREVEEADQIKAYITSHDVKTVTLIGAGIASLEITENLYLQGITVNIVEKLDHVGYPYDEEITKLLLEELERNGTHVYLNHVVQEVINNGHTIVTNQGKELTQDMIIVAAGVTPNTDFLKESGLTINERGFIPVDQHLATNIPDIYAIGDIVETKSYITGLPQNSVLSGPANRQGHLLADIFAGQPYQYDGIVGTSVGKIFDQTVSFVGYTETMLQEVGIKNYKTIFITPFDYANFYPGATRVNLKLIFDADTGKILGGQAYGEKGIDKRMGELSTAIYGHLTVYDLPALELPYSPPYSTTRDPLNTAGYVAINQLKSTVATVKIAEIPEEAAFFLDVREAGKAPSGSIKPTLNIPLSELRDRITEIPTDKPIYLTFRPGLVNYTAARILTGNQIEAKIIME
ncbi:CoA-disulfide reductase [Amylolactobacillus amylotrophicus DSM 20534]|uniref:Pyridine nucleotide-disulfide oxidoreductase n=3 Tax=Amylolactobacillus TaxID=2767876 RepID=A0A1L6XC82_9LACO|nr:MULTISPECIES: FAD-dependent oxidoreductase [Amylolactobacillus]APT18584.1 pyridine nucleotide-disulfide oxidoreductase [Amylolactobacillus amylophilus DSM 20533 = JCM 1125]KRK36802.1 CoA-disulfide reductase [Amylolactobacillus amylotrophicus DSM 20534]KRM43312.1 CoA-disulfide reductase [Amylolactobacillus amylophilus DSM 20533 = JCM 1125]GED80961.1 CoA-disulfide reductase [Amylolactobacillus amylophilus]